LGQGANQALQDAYFLARGIKQINDDIKPSSPKFFLSVALPVKLKQLTLAYEWRRKLPIAILGVKATILGEIETLSGPLGMWFRNSFFKVMASIGVVEQSFVDAALPKL
jgi:2-polyprenyl-6-methoxyphenol hydroxylase-like FAD-dependent oxidoreductase